MLTNRFIRRNTDIELSRIKRKNAQIQLQMTEIIKATLAYHCFSGCNVFIFLFEIQEEKAELKSVNYLLEKEKSALELQLSGKQSQEQAYMLQIDHLKSELSEQHKRFVKNSKKVSVHLVFR